MNVRMSNGAVRFRLSESEFKTLGLTKKLSEAVTFPDGNKFSFKLALVDGSETGLDLAPYVLNCVITMKSFLDYSSGKMGKNDSIEVTKHLADGNVLRLSVAVDVFTNR